VPARRLGRGQPDAQDDPSGTEALWERQYLKFYEGADADPGIDGVDVFTQINHYQLDFSVEALVLIVGIGETQPAAVGVQTPFSGQG